ncbi:hypothetical protein AJ318_15925 [Escherichia coli]|nr:hypothetical protein A6V20_28400 [Escherichia coli]PWR56137.1 hypothetical protein AJ318_15925 [Escherichia coli]
MHTRRVGIHRRSTVSLNLNPRALSRIHHNAKDSLWLKILSCYVPAFSHIRRGGRYVSYLVVFAFDEAR